MPAARACHRRDAILAIARAAFLDHGYSGTSLSAIAAKAGGSKTTFWSTFPSKEALFAAVLDDLVAQFRAQLVGLLDPAGEVADTLRAFARAMLEKLLSEPAVRLRRLIYAEVERFPEIGRLYYERGPEQSLRSLATYIAEQMAAGQLRPADPLCAAAQFLYLLQGGLFQRAILKIGMPPAADDISAEARATVDTFMRAYGNLSGRTASRDTTTRPVHSI